MTRSTRVTLDGLPPQPLHRSRDSGIPNSPTRTVTIGNLHDDVLLEIFDFYRQSFRDQPSHERVWNNKNGWFKLAHVCHNWRSVVLTSPYRLRVRLYFAHDTPTRAAVLQSLSHLPIVVDYSNVTWNPDTLGNLISALRYPDRVCRIAIRGLYMSSVMLSKALDLSFPALECLELQSARSFETTNLSVSPFMTSIQSLRRLQLYDANPTGLLSEVLSITTSLVDLNLGGMVTILSLMDGVPIFTHLQRMPHLRNFQVSTAFGFPLDDEVEIPPTPTTTMLAELTYFHFSAGLSEIEWFVAGLVAPSLRELYISIYDVSGGLHIQNLSKFIHTAGMIFFAARLTISKTIFHHTFKTSLFALPVSIDDPPSKIVTIETLLLPRLDSASSPMLASVKDIFLSLSNSVDLDKALPRKRLRKFFKGFRNVKTLRLHWGLETIVADLLQPPTEIPPPAGEEVDSDATTPTSTPINHSGSQFTLDILPLLEEINVYSRTRIMSFGEEDIASVFKPFGPFMAARHRVGRPVKAFWNVDGEVPRYFI